MTEQIDKGGGIRQWVIAVCRDLTVFSVAATILGTVTFALLRPYITPYLEAPAKQVEATEERLAIKLAVERIEATLNEGRDFRLVDFEGVGLIIDAENAYPGGWIEVFYMLRRNASCDSDIVPKFFDMGTKLVTQGPIIPSVKAPVTATFIPFALRIRLPDEIFPGFYTYIPDVVPKDCGVYDRMTVTPTQIFEVKQRGTR